MVLSDTGTLRIGQVRAQKSPMPEPGVGNTMEGATDALHREAKILWELRGTKGLPQFLSYSGRQGAETRLEMEYIQGKTLEELPSLSVEEAVICLRSLLETLQRVHQKGYAHLDVKPPNIMVTEVGPVLLDFGAALRFGEPVEAWSPMSSPPEVTRSYGALPDSGGALRPVSRPIAAPAIDTFSLGLSMKTKLCSVKLEGTGQRRVTTADVLFAKEWRALLPSSVKSSRAGENLLCLLEAMTANEPGERPSIETALKELDRIERTSERRRKRFVAQAISTLSRLSSRVRRGPQLRIRMSKKSRFSRKVARLLLALRVARPASAGTLALAEAK